MEKLITLSSSDIRLHPNLQRKCSNELKQFCDHLDPGNSRVLTCLRAEYEMSDKGFSAVCAAAVKRIVLPQKKIQTYKDASGGVSTTKKRGIYSNLVKLTKKLDPILDGIDPSLKNLWRNPQSFLVLQGPI